MKIFITGGAGFIGSNLVDRLMSLGHTVSVYDNLSSGKKKFVEQHLNNKKFRFIQADVLDFKTLNKSLKNGYDIVFHLSSNPDISRSIKQPDLDLYQGIIATFNVIESMRQNNIKKIVFLSGSGIYGDIGDKYASENYGPLIPISMYGASKLSAEGLISAYSHMFDMKSWIFRLANIVGPRLTHGVIYDFINKLKNNSNELLVLGDGKQSKSYLHVNDTIDAILLCLKRSNDNVNIFNVASNNYITVTEIANIVIREMKLKNVKLKYTGGKRGWKGDVPVVRLDTTKINKLNWKPKLNSYEAVTKAVKENL